MPSRSSSRTRCVFRYQSQYAAENRPEEVVYILLSQGAGSIHEEGNRRYCARCAAARYGAPQNTLFRGQIVCICV